MHTRMSVHQCGFLDESARLVEDRGANPRFEQVAIEPGAQRFLEIDASGRKQASEQSPIRGEPDPVAHRAEWVGDRRNDAEAERAVQKIVTRRFAGARHWCDLELTAQKCDQIPLAEDLVWTP